MELSQCSNAQLVTQVLPLCRLHEMNPTLAAARLPAAFHALVPQLVAEQEGVRFGTQQALKNLVHDCLSSHMVSTAVSQGTLRGGGVAPAQSIVAAVASSLGARGQDGWTHALPGGLHCLLRCGLQTCLVAVTCSCSPGVAGPSSSVPEPCLMLKDRCVIPCSSRETACTSSQTVGCI